MTILTHFVAGAAIGRTVKWRSVGLGLALVSHFALDAIPHFEHAGMVAAPWRPVARWIPRVMCLLVVPLVWLIWRRVRPPTGAAAYAVLGGGVACLPDLLYATFGSASVLGWPNVQPHRLWEEWLGVQISLHGLWWPFAAPLAITLELLVLALSGWLLFRRTSSRTRTPAQGD